VIAIVKFSLVQTEIEDSEICNSSPAFSAVLPHQIKVESVFFCALLKVGLSVPAIEAVVGNVE
jgi:hypothetical protein